MRVIYFVLTLAGVWSLYMLVARMRRQVRRRRALALPFPDEWNQILQTNLAVCNNLAADLQEELRRDIQVFLAEKRFEGCGGLTVTDEMRVTIAAQACMLLLNRDVGIYPKLRSVLVYPTTYVAGGKGLFGGKEQSKSVRLGESWGHGSVVLSWDNVKQGAYNFDDGHNVTMHEFAHQLDQEDGAADGAPILGQRSAYASWARVLSKDYARLQRKKKKGKRSLMSDYGATNPAEFFAVATETFFEKPVQLQKKHPELYEQLRGYYKVNPVEWV